VILRAYTYYDTKALFFNTPFFLHSDGEAIRTSVDLGEDMQTRIGRHPEDYILFCVGTFDNANGLLVAHAPENLGPVSSMLPPKSNGELFERKEFRP